MTFMLELAGIALRKASSPVLGTLVSGEYRTALAGGKSDKQSDSGRGAKMLAKIATIAPACARVFHTSSHNKPTSHGSVIFYKERTTENFLSQV